MNKKGNTIVEAALVFPVILLSLMTVISILIFLFHDAASQADLHTEIRSEVGKTTGTFSSRSGSSRVEIDFGFRGISRVMNGSTYVTFEKTEIISRWIKKPIYGFVHVIDERKYARYIDLFQIEENE